MQKINKYLNYIVAGVLLVLGVFLYISYEKNVQTLEDEHMALQVSLVQEYVKEKKFAASQEIQRLQEALFKENQKLEENATYELKQKVDKLYENLHILFAKYKKQRNTKKTQDMLLDFVRYGVHCKEKDTFFISNFEAELLYWPDATKEDQNYALYTDADGRTIALELIQKVRKYSQTYINTTTHEGSRELIYAKNLDLYDWFVGASIDLSKRSKNIEKQFIAQTKSIGQGSREFIALYSKKDAEFVYQQSGDAFDATQIDTVTSNLFDKATWYTNTIDTNYYYSDYIPSLDLYIIYGFAIKKLVP